MDCTLQRAKAGATGIFGGMYGEDGAQLNVTLEHAYQAPNGSWVPKLAPGVYICKRYHSPKHGYDVFVVQGVPEFQGQPVKFIELHIGNRNEDSEGCVLIGTKWGPDCITQSKVAFDRFMDLQKGVGGFTLTVE